MKKKIMQWQNKHHKLAITVVALLGYVLHVVYEVVKHVHAGKPLTLDALIFLTVVAFIVAIGAGLMGWAIDLYFTKSEEEAGEIQSGPESH